MLASEGQGQAESEAPSLDQLRQELLEAVDELDRACAKVRQVIFQIRPKLWTRRERQ